MWCVCEGEIENERKYEVKKYDANNQLKESVQATTVAAIRLPGCTLKRIQLIMTKEYRVQKSCRRLHSY